MRLAGTMFMVGIAPVLIAPNVADAGPVSTPAGVAMPTKARLAVTGVRITQSDPMTATIVTDAPEKLWAGKETFVRIGLEEQPYDEAARFRPTSCRVDRFSGSPPALVPVTVVTATVLPAWRGTATGDKRRFLADCRIPARAFATPGAYQIGVVGGLYALAKQTFYAGSRMFVGNVEPTPTPKRL